MTRVIFCLLILAGAGRSADDWKQQPILNLEGSPHAKLQGVPVRAVTLGAGFWEQRRKVNVERSIPTLLDLLESNGVVDNFRRLSGRKHVERRGPLYTDSDLYKWMEAVAFVLQSGDDPRLRATVDRLIDEVLAAQEPGGYLNTYYQDDRKDKRWTEMQRGHELYCLGHMLQAAIAYYRAGGGRRLLDGGIRFVDYLVENFGPTRRPLLAGHPEIELALVELYRTTGERKYLDLAGYILRGDGERLKLTPRELTYMFSGKPFTGRTRFEGHAVRAMYAASGAADYFMETGEPAYRKTLDTLWDDMARRKVYITGGVGSRSSGEAFGEPYELPNQLAYTESCAAIGNLFFNWRMLAATGDARYAGMIERALYNGVNSGMSLDGTLYCYRNPLMLTGNPEDKIRNPWYSTTCCPPNLERVLASLPGYFYSTSADGVYVHLYHDNALDWRLDDGTGLKLSQSTRYPWEGTVEIRLEPAAAKEFTLFLRVPEWSRSTEVSVNGAPPSGPAPQPGTYLSLKRTWNPGDTVRLVLDVKPQVIEANPRVRDNTGKVAITRGPLVYAMEGIDQPAPLFDTMLTGDIQSFSEHFQKDLLGGIVVLKHKGAAYTEPQDRRPLYEPLRKRPVKPVELTLVPYYVFANREPTPMQVWIPRE
jgi:DUF1680 family protein